MTRQEWTFEVMNGAYLMSNGEINEDYLNDVLQEQIMNCYSLYKMLKNKRTKRHSIAWMALMYETNNRLKLNGYNAECTSAQLKKWLQMHGAGYETLNQTLVFVFDQRLELLEAAK